MRFGIFTDAHYCHQEKLLDKRFPLRSLELMERAMEAFRQEGCEKVVCLGDLIDHSETKAEVLACIREIQAVLDRYDYLNENFIWVPGNHDYLDLSREEMEALFPASPFPPFEMETEQHRLMFLDGNYRSDGRRYDEAGVEWTDSQLPRAQEDWLAGALWEEGKPWILLVHQNLDPHIDEFHSLNNAAKIREILTLHPGQVAGVLQGHYHPGADRTEYGIRFRTYPAMCEADVAGGEPFFFIEEL